MQYVSSGTIADPSSVKVAHGPSKNPCAYRSTTGLAKVKRCY